LGFANHPQYIFRDPEGVTFKPGDIKKMGTYTVAYENAVIDPGKLIQARFLIADAQGKVTEATPGIEIMRGEGEAGMTMQPRRVAIPEIKDDKGMGVIYLDKVDAGSKSATVRISLPDYRGVWLVPLAVTFKPGINIVWIGVLVTGAGVLLAMFRRALEARKVVDDVPDSEEDWEATEENKAPLKQRVPATASAFEEEAPAEPKRRLKKAPKPQV
jgi:cytochrome c-type biogenesis protein CcmF